MGFFLNPLLIERAAQHLESERSNGRKRLPDLGSLMLLLNACHAAQVRGEVVVSQAYLAARCGGASVRAVRAWEQELVAAGLLVREGPTGGRRTLRLVEPDKSSPQVIHTVVSGGGTGRVVPVAPAGRRRCGSPVLHRARVSQRTLQVSEGPGCSPGEAFERSARQLVRSLRVRPDRAHEILEAAAELPRAIGLEEATRALEQVGPWVLREARSDPGSLAVHAIRARARRASTTRIRQHGLFS